VALVAVPKEGLGVFARCRWRFCDVFHGGI
jgi:hypothetical protein